MVAARPKPFDSTAEYYALNFAASEKNYIADPTTGEIIEEDTYKINGSTPVELMDYSGGNLFKATSWNYIYNPVTISSTSMYNSFVNTGLLYYKEANGYFQRDYYLG